MYGLLSSSLRLLSPKSLGNSFVATNGLFVRGVSDIRVGSSAQLSKTFTSEDVQEFARLSGDYNPIHLDDKYCSQTKFSRPIVHGMLTNGY